jgi:hypothetical protein
LFTVFLLTVCSEKNRKGREGEGVRGVGKGVEEKGFGERSFLLLSSFPSFLIISLLFSFLFFL